MRQTYGGPHYFCLVGVGALAGTNHGSNRFSEGVRFGLFCADAHYVTVPRATGGVRERAPVGHDGASLVLCRALL